MRLISPRIACSNTSRTLRDGTRIEVYECSRRRRYVAGKEEHAGAQRRFRAVHVDAAVRRWLMDLRRDPDAALTRASLTRERSAKSRVEAAAERERAQKELAGLGAEESRAADLAVKGLLSDAQLESQLSRVSARRAELEAILSQQEPDQSLEETVEGVVALRPKDMRQMISMPRERGVAVGKVIERILSDAEALEHWRGQVKDHVRVVWLEDDGRITIEGPLPALTVLPSLHT